jgi:hypothetical protein
LPTSAIPLARLLAALVLCLAAALLGAGCAAEPRENSTLEEVAEDEGLVGRRVTLIAPVREILDAGTIVLSEDDERVLVTTDSTEAALPRVGQRVQATGRVERLGETDLAAVAPDWAVEAGTYLRAFSIEVVPGAD